MMARAGIALEQETMNVSGSPMNRQDKPSSFPKVNSMA